MKKDTITQVCDKYKITIKLKLRKISFYSLQSGDENELFFNVDLPRRSQRSKIDFFTPIINKNKTRIVLAMSYGLTEGWSDEKYHSLVLVDLQQKRAFQNDGMTEYFRKVAFKSDDELICQNRRGVFMI